MRQFVKKIFFFAFFAFFSYCIYLFIWVKYIPKISRLNFAHGHLYNRLSEVKGIKNIDVLFLGSSLAYRGFDTRIFKTENICSFNLGSSSQTPMQTKVLLNRYIAQLNPRIIIYEVFPYTFGNDGVESSLDIIINDIIDLQSIRMALEINNINVYNTLIYKFTEGLLNFDRKDIPPNKINDDTYIPGGFVEKELHYFKNLDYPQQKW